MKGFFNLNNAVSEDEIKGEVLPAREIYRDYWQVAWPASIEGIFLNLILLADLVMVGKLGIAQAAAIGIVSQPKMIMQMIGKSLGTGVTAVVSRRKGEKDHDSMNSCIRKSFLLTIVIYIVLVILALMFRRQIMTLMGANSEYIDYAVMYFTYLTFALFFKALSAILTAVEVAVGKTKIILQASVAGNIVNVILNYVLIFGKFGFPRLEIKGAAIATICGEFVIFAMLLRSVLLKNKEDGIDMIHGGRNAESNLSPVLKVGGNAFCEQIFERVGLFIFARLIAELGTVPVATHHYCIIIWDLYYYFGIGMATASSSFAGRKLGEKRPDLAKLYTKAAQKSGFVVSIAVSIFIVIARTGLFGLLMDDPAGIALGSKIMLIVAALIIPQTQGQILAGTLRGAGYNGFIARYSLFVSAILRSGIAYVLAFKVGIGLYGMWIALAIDELLKMFLTSGRIKKGIWLEKEF